MDSGHLVILWTEKVKRLESLCWMHQKRSSELRGGGPQERWWNASLGEEDWERRTLITQKIHQLYVYVLPVYVFTTRDQSDPILESVILKNQQGNVSNNVTSSLLQISDCVVIVVSENRMDVFISPELGFNIRRRRANNWWIVLISTIDNMILKYFLLYLNQFKFKSFKFEREE